MDNGLHLISGLPRSGSTLLAALLRQNPHLHAGISSPVASLVLAMQRQLSQENEGAPFIDDEQRVAILRGVFEGFYAKIHPGKLVLDTNRAWCAKLPLLAMLFPDIKVIACVRDVRWIMDSFERLIRANALEPSRIFNFDASGTVYSRIDVLSGGNGLVGYALNALREAFFGEHAHRLLLVTYETLTREPGRAPGGDPRFSRSPHLHLRCRARLVRGRRVRPSPRHAGPAQGHPSRGLHRARDDPAARPFRELHQRRLLARPLRRTSAACGSSEPALGALAARRPSAANYRVFSCRRCKLVPRLALG